MKLRSLLIIMCFLVAMIPIGIIGGVQGFQFATFFLIGLITVVTFVVSIVISHLISRSLMKLTYNIEKISKGDLEVELESSDITEINALTEALNRVMTSLKLAIHKVGVKRGEIFEETMKAAKQVEEKYYKLVQNLDDVVWETDPKGTLAYCSPQITDLLGYSPTELEQTALYTHVSKSNEKEIQRIFTSVNKDPQRIDHFDCWWKHKNGKKVFLRTSAVPLYNNTGGFVGFLGVLHDLTPMYDIQQKNDELVQKLSEMKQRARSLMKQDSSPLKSEPKSPPTPIPPPQPQPLPRMNLSKLPLECDSMFMFDDHLKIVDCSQTLLHHLGYSRDELLGLKVPDVDIFETHESIAKKLNDIKKQGSVRVKTMHRRKDGTSILVRQDIYYDEHKQLFTCYVKEEML